MLRASLTCTERGPNWIHGTDNNPILKIAEETGTRLHAWDEEQAVISTDGRTLDAAEAGHYAELMWDDGVIADAFRYSNENFASIPASRSLYDFFKEKAADLFADEHPESSASREKTLLEMASAWGAYVGSPVTTQSLRFFWLEECIEGENPFVAGTYARILNSVAQPAQLKAEVCLDTEVIRVFSRPGQSGHNGRTPNTVCITSAGGETTSYDEVVITTPLGWLKRNKHVFEPPLTPRLDQAIQNIGYGTLDKVYITFPSAFWDVPVQYATPTNGFDPNGKTPNVTATTTPLDQPLRSNAEEHYPGFTHWLSPAYAPDTNPKHWDQQGMNMAALPAKCAHPTILFYVYGPCSQHIADLVASLPSETSDNELIEFFKPYYSRLPNYDASNADCRPKAVLATAWANDKFAGHGSYSNFQVGLEKGDEDIEVMREGMPERGIWFAGEHTAPFVALGTSTGAYWSGERVAERIAKVYGLTDVASRS